MKVLDEMSSHVALKVLRIVIVCDIVLAVLSWAAWLYLGWNWLLILGVVDLGSAWFAFYTWKRYAEIVHACPYCDGTGMWNGRAI